MKTLALIAMLMLQWTGLWHQASNTHRTTLARLAATGTVHPTPALLPVLDILIPTFTGHGQPYISTSTEALAVDAATGKILFSQNANQPHAMASITKLVTSLVILSRHSPSEMVKIKTLPVYEPGDALIGLQTGEAYHLGDLVRAMLVPSADDAADALALYDAGSTSAFAAHMNEKLNQWGINGTRFNNPSGLIDKGNYASAEALYRVAQLALANPFISTTVEQTNVSITSTSGRALMATTTNDLLSTGLFYGIKTGYTAAAGECFVGLTTVHSHKIITIVLGSPDRFGETQTLANWISKNYQWR